MEWRVCNQSGQEKQLLQIERNLPPRPVRATTCTCLAIPPHAAPHLGRPGAPVRTRPARWRAGPAARAPPAQHPPDGTHSVVQMGIRPAQSWDAAQQRISSACTNALACTCIPCPTNPPGPLLPATHLLLQEGPHHLPVLFAAEIRVGAQLVWRGSKQQGQQEQGQ